jgi:hypothetical protein
MTERIPDSRLPVDQAGISDALHRYASGLDARDWDLWASALTDPVSIDMSSFTGLEAVTLPREKHVRAASLIFAGLDVTQHMITNHRHFVDNDTARVVAHMRAEHWAAEVQGGDRFTMFGYYDDRLVRTDDGWRISHVKLVCTRYTGNLEVMNGAHRRGKAKQA